MKIKTALLAFMISGAGALPVSAQATPASMMDECRAFANSVVQAPPEQIEVKYEGQRTDGTVTVLGSDASSANTIVMVGVGPQDAPWRCLVSGGVVAEFSTMTDEGFL